MFLEFSAFRTERSLTRMVKAAVKGHSRNTYGLDMNSAPELYRHDPLARADRSKSPETVMTYTYDFKQPIACHPHNNPTEMMIEGIKPFKPCHIPRRIFQPPFQQEARDHILVTVFRGMMLHEMNILRISGEKFSVSMLRPTIKK